MKTANLFLSMPEERDDNVVATESQLFTHGVHKHHHSHLMDFHSEFGVQLERRSSVTPES